MNNQSIATIIVTYNPNLSVLEGLIRSIYKKSEKIIVIDNFHKDTSYLNFETIAEKYSVILKKLDKNYGIAKAQNEGLNICSKLDIGYVLFFDQDSSPDQHLVENLLKAHQKLSLEIGFEKIGILGARYLDSRQNNPPPFIKFGLFRLKRCNCESPDSIVDVDYVISSGSLISMHGVNVIGGMREDLFIDYVDIEWGLRAKHKGLLNFGVCSALMEHSLGDNPVKFGKKFIPIHSPLRHYYHFRNAILLYKESWVPGNWKIIDGYRLCLKFVFYSLFTENPMSHCYKMILGIYHGIIGKSGQLTED